MRSRYLPALLLFTVLLSACSNDPKSTNSQLSNIPTQHVGAELTFEGEPGPEREINRTFKEVAPFYNEAFTSIEYLNHLELISTDSGGGNYFFKRSYNPNEEAAEMVLKAFGIEPNPSAYRDCISDLNSASFAVYFCHAVEQGWFEPYEEGIEEWQKEITEIEFLKLLLNVGFQDELAQLTEDEISKALYNKQDINVSDWQAPYITLAKKINLGIDGSPYRIDWEDEAETLARALLVKKGGWDFYHPYFRYQYFKEQNLEHLIDRQCYRASTLEFNFLNDYLKTEYNINTPLKHFGPYESIKNEPLPFFDNEYFCPLKNGGYLFSNSIVLNRNAAESHLMEFDSEGKIVRDRSFICEPFSATGTRSFNMSPVENPDRFELLGCNYGRDDRRVYSFGKKLNDDPYSSNPKRTSQQLLDIDSFEVLNSTYAKDKDTIFCEGNDIYKFDYGTFEALNNNYAKDKNQVYFQCGDSYIGSTPEIHEADPESFEVVGEYHSKDKNHAYYMSSIIPKVHLKSFRAINNHYSADKNNVYSGTKIVESADPESFEMIEDSVFSKDKKHVYYLGYYDDSYLIEGADSETFQVLSYGYAKDKNKAFHYSNHSKGTFESVDIDTFEIMPAYGWIPFARDKNHVYCESTVVSNNPESFDYEGMRFTCPFPYNGPSIPAVAF